MQEEQEPMKHWLRGPFSPSTIGIVNRFGTVKGISTCETNLETENNGWLFSMPSSVQWFQVTVIHGSEAGNIPPKDDTQIKVFSQMEVHMSRGV